MSWLSVIGLLLLTIVMFAAYKYSGTEKHTDCLCKGCSREDDDCCTVDDCMENGTEAAKTHIKARPTGKEWDEFDKQLGQPSGEINLCDTCTNEVPTCTVPSDEIEYGNGAGNDNVVSCSGYVDKEAIPLGFDGCHCQYESNEACRMCDIGKDGKR